MWLWQNDLLDQAWLCNLNHDELVLVAHRDIAYELAEKANGFIANSFQRYVPDYKDNADIASKVLRSWDEKN
ncbi:MAG: hypothetical protein HC878_00160 [Leptolyngbyaceae cyanobacterium SL_5_14]|nr:hypothetical protein [Leptolyngbyaceae cyanobacterium SL_5_14]